MCRSNIYIYINIYVYSIYICNYNNVIRMLHSHHFFLKKKTITSSNPEPLNIHPSPQSPLQKSGVNMPSIQTSWQIMIRNIKKLRKSLQQVAATHLTYKLDPLYKFRFHFHANLPWFLNRLKPPFQAVSF